MKKFLQSLLVKYMFIILLGLSLIPIGYMLIILSLVGLDNINPSKDPTEVIEQKWHAEANNIENSSQEKIKQLFSNWKQQYSDASMFWIDKNGKLSEQIDLKEPIPSQWDPTFTAKFMKERYVGDPFTVVAFVGYDEKNGFVVLEIPRSTVFPALLNFQRYYESLLLGLVFITLLFIGISFLFFRGIRRRLAQLQYAMTIRDVDGLPIQLEVKKNDEIGQLQQTFNQMVFELRESKEREQKEEKLRRELITNLSHDLRTPLTKIRAQTYSMAQADLSQEGKQAIQGLEDSIIHMDRLIENLMSYTLLIASKYKFEPKEIDIVRFVRECLASWYPAFEKEKFEVGVELQPFPFNKWFVDPIWFGRIVDNFFQNVLRHAKDGQYIEVKTESTDHYDGFVISDRGKGMEYESKEQGAGIGLSIVDLMVKGMKLDWNMESSSDGTIIRIKKYK